MENGLTLSLEETQSVLALEDLSGTLEALSKLLRAAEYRGRERGSSGATWRVVWLHHSVPTVVVAPDPPTDTAVAAARFVMGTVRRLETGQRPERSLTKPEEDSLSRLAAYASRYRLRLNVEGTEAVVVTLQTQTSLEAFKHAATYERGTVEGRLEMVTIRGRMECSLYDDLTGNRVRCYFDEVMLKELLFLFGQHVVAEGQITAVAGRVDSLRIEGLRQMDPPRDISLDAYFGMGRDWFDEVPAGTLVHRAWDSD